MWANTYLLQFKRSLVRAGLSEVTIARYLREIGYVIDFIQTRLGRAVKLTDLTASRLRIWREACVALAPATIAGRLGSLTRFIEFALEEGQLRKDPIEAAGLVPPRRPKRRPNPLSEEEMYLLLEQPTKGPIELTALRDVAMLWILIEAGLRGGELAGLQLAHLRWNFPLPGVVTLDVTGKGAKEDMVPIVGSIKALQAYLARRPEILAKMGVPDSGHIFLNLQTGGPLTTPPISMAVCRYAKAVGIKACAHRLRHTAATLMQLHGAELRAVQSILRHDDPECTARYAAVTPEFQLARGILCHPLNHGVRALFGLPAIFKLGPAAPRKVLRDLSTTVEGLSPLLARGPRMVALVERVQQDLAEMETLQAAA